jgi:hypothetical protein
VESIRVVADGIAEPQILPHEAEARESAEAESSYPPVDSFEDRQYYQVRLHWRDAGVIHVLATSQQQGGLENDLRNATANTGIPQIQRQEETLEEDEDRYLNNSPQ